MTKARFFDASIKGTETMIEQHYTVAEVAVKLRRSRKWVLKAIACGQLRAIKLASPDSGKVTNRTRIIIPESAVLEMCGESPKPKRKVDQARARRAAERLGLDFDACGSLA